MRYGDNACDAILNDFNFELRIYLAVEFTDMRKSIDGFAAIVQEFFQLNPFSYRKGLKYSYFEKTKRDKKKYHFFCKSCDYQLCDELLSYNHSFEDVYNLTRFRHLRNISK